MILTIAIAVVAGMNLWESLDALIEKCPLGAALHLVLGLVGIFLAVIVQ